MAQRLVLEEIYKELSSSEVDVDVALIGNLAHV